MKNILFIITFLSYLTIYSQGYVGVKSNIYDLVNAKNAIKQCNDYNLKGKVKQLEVISSDKLFFSQKFNRNGMLIKEEKGDNITSYKFYNNILTSIAISNSSYSNKRDSSISFYNKKGQLLQSITIYNDGDEVKKSTSQYTYKNGWKNILINYKYAYDTSIWDITLKDEYILQFNTNGKIKSINNKNYHREHTYETNTIYRYDSLNNKVVGISYKSTDYGSNSAPYIELSITYGKNIINELLRDFTVRNSFNYDIYTYKKFNKNNDVVEESRTSKNHFHPAISEKSLPTYYSYTYDSNGNWIEKYKREKSTKSLISKRIIEYYN